MSELTTLEAIRQTCEKSKEYTENWLRGEGENSLAHYTDPSAAQGKGSFVGSPVKLDNKDNPNQYSDIKDEIEQKGSKEEKIAAIIEKWNTPEKNKKFQLAYGVRSAIFGATNLCFGQSAFACGEQNILHGAGSFASGLAGITKGLASAVFGQGCQANDTGTFAQGQFTEANGHSSHTEGLRTKTTENASGSHAEGEGTIANARAQHVSGTYNEEDADALFIVGNGYKENEDDDSPIIRQNAFVVKKDGSVRINVSPVDDKDITTKGYVDSCVNNLGEQFEELKRDVQLYITAQEYDGTVTVTNG